MLGIDRIRRLAREACDRAFPGTLVLLYHRVAELPTDPFDLCVAPRAFAEHLEVMRKLARPVPLRSLALAMGRGSAPRKGVVVTFDDGYADNLLAAAPLLEEHDVPATFFIATGYIGSGREFWWDELERIVRAADPGGGEDGRPRRGWKYSDDDLADPGLRRYRELYPRLQAMAPGDRDRALRELGERVGLGPGARPDYRAMDAEELARLASSGLFEVGAHTVHHPLLPMLDGPAQLREIRESKSWLEATIGRRVEQFSYPHGGLTAETARLAREAGLSTASSTRAAIVSGREDRFAIPRVVPEGLDGDGFARFLRGWFAGGRVLTP